MKERRMEIDGFPLKKATIFYRATPIERWLCYWFGSFWTYEVTLLDGTTLQWRRLFGRNYIIKEIRKP